MQRADIIQAAAQIFRMKGFHAASMQDIADAVQLQKASLYHHIESKQEILATILDEAVELLISDLENVLASNCDPAEKVRRAMRAYIGRLTENTDLASVLLLEYRSLEGETRSKHMLRRDRYEGLWRELIDSGVRAGVFRDIDVAMITFALLGVQNWTITWYRETGRLSPNEIADHFCDLFFSGLLVKPEVRDDG